MCGELDMNKSINNECATSMSWREDAVLNPAQLCTQSIQFRQRMGLVPLPISPSRRHVRRRRQAKCHESSEYCQEAGTVREAVSLLHDVGH